MVLQRKGSYEPQNDPAFASVIRKTRGMTKHFIPVAGYFMGLAAVPGVAAAFTYAVGKVFVQHFGSGGTFLDFDPKTVREYFARQFEEGKLVAAKIKPDASRKADAPTQSA
jgi:uncharacterized protein (DUF697 family)